MSSAPRYQLVVLSPGSCHSCLGDIANPQSVTIESIEQQGGVGWKLSGTGRIAARCPRCAAMYNAVRAAIPIECSSYVCPDCGETQSLRYNVQRVEAQGTDFTFQAEITCSKCHKKKSFIETLKDLLKLKKLEVNLNGISIER